MPRHITTTIQDGIGHVRLSRPDKLNALTLDMLDDLAAAAHGLRSDRRLRAVVVSGEGDSFCAGLDFGSAMKKPSAIASRFVPRPWRGTNTFQEAPWALRRLPVPVIAAVSGHCLGGGLQIALAADFRITHPEATWSVLEGRWGIIPDMSGVQALSELVGIDVAKKLTMTADKISGTRAHELGLATEVAADPVAAATELAQQLATRSPDALAATKRLFDGTWNRSPRYTFARERREQLPLLFGPNAARARAANARKESPDFLPRQRRMVP
ncbi:crotonase/enoyl-CoA hydratase family protein [Janibacter sp. CX7]|jgi:enoyl-CoA hydratase/carnithine racemase|uniref:crotonase/enoyl-CoA hydratase family protein n=1 Tax=Janibacter sp. CX7 TaxID=2963431 RepID=UPI0020CCD0D3|nr:crotonase/enoyl-CoA hydratase family protein [Janibacter sp. CX7]UTT65909.1 crotonase/enoyl-CoA hydratase family protein [Janibacter sp. CX7]